MNKKLQNLFLIQGLFFSCLNLLAGEKDLSAYTGPVVIIPEKVEVAPTFLGKCCTYSDNPFLPSTYLQKIPGVCANVALVAAIAMGAGLATKPGRDFTGKLMMHAAQVTAAQIASHGSSFAVGAVVGGAVVNTWYQEVKDPELVEETRGKDFARFASAQGDSGA